VATALGAAGAASEASRPPWARRGPEPGYPDLLVQAKDLLPDAAGVQLVDARPRAAFERGRLPRALSLEPGRLPRRPEELASALGTAGLASARPIVCYADAAHGAALGELFWLLEVAGARSVRVLDGGLEGWRAAGGRMEAPLGAPAPAAFTARPDTSRFADRAYVEAIYGQSGFEILEARSEAEWEQGHLPHALAFPVDSLAAPGGGLRPPPALRAALAAFGPRPRDYLNLDDEFVICLEGGRPEGPSLYLAARLAGLPRVRAWDGGFRAWREKLGAPVVRIVQAPEVRAKIGGATWWDRVRGKSKPKALLFDLRGERDYASGHLPGAISLPSHRFDEELEGVLRERWPELDRATVPVILYCYGPDCIRSRQCASLAARHGFQDLLWFRDGINGWYAAGETLVTGP
jgi:thiosulfate/3-mercaptopyruvate sulfurtransferase